MTNFKSLIKFPAGDFATLHYRNIRKEKKEHYRRAGVIMNPPCYSLFSLTYQFWFYYVIILPFSNEMGAGKCRIPQWASSFTGGKTCLHLPVVINMYEILYMTFYLG